MTAQAPRSDPTRHADRAVIGALDPDVLRREADRWGRTWVEIDRDALRRNAGRVARLLPAGARIVVSAKKDAYGHGLLAVAAALHDHPAIGAFGVATVEEALTLVRAGCELPVLCFAPLAGEALAEAIRCDVTLTVTGLHDAIAADETARALRATARAHLKVDTGMGRMGLLPDEVAEETALIAQLRAVQLEAIYSHMADAWGDPAGAREQWRRLDTFRLRAGVGRLPIHWGGSDALALKECFGPRVWLRSGIALYGEHPAVADLEPVMTFKSRVIFRRAVPAGTPISYGGDYVTDRPTELAIVGAGYGNGYPRAVSGRGAAVLIHGRRCPVLGRVCMDQIIVDVTDPVAAGCPVVAGDEAVLFGRQGDARLPAGDVARQAGTIAYELFCLAGQLNPHRFAESRP